LALIIDLLAFALILPLFPRIIKYYVSQPDSGINGGDGVLIGGILSFIYSILQFLSSFIIGSSSDKYGRKPVLLLSMIGTCLSHFIWFIAGDSKGGFTLFVISRVIGGVTKGIVQISSSIIADVTPNHSRTKGMALVGVAFSIGFTVGPLIGAYFAKLDLHVLIQNLENTLLSNSGSQIALIKPVLNFLVMLSQIAPHPFSVPALFSLILSLIDFVFIALFLPETRNYQIKSSIILAKEEKGEEKQEEKEVKISEDERRYILNRLHCIHFFYLLLFSGVESTLTFLTFDRFSYSNQQNGRVFFVIGVVSSLIQGGYLRRMGYKIGEERIATQGIITMIIGTAIMGLSFNEPLFYCGLIFFSFTSAVVVSCLNSVTSFYARKDLKGTELGKSRSYGQLGRAIGPLVISFCYSNFSAFFAYFLAATCAILPLILLIPVGQVMIKHRKLKAL